MVKKYVNVVGEYTHGYIYISKIDKKSVKNADYINVQGVKI